MLHTSEVAEKNTARRRCRPRKELDCAFSDASSDEDVLRTCQHIAAKVAKVDRVEGSSHIRIRSMEGPTQHELENGMVWPRTLKPLTDDELTLEALVSVLRRGGHAGPRTEGRRSLDRCRDA